MSMTNTELIKKIGLILFVCFLVIFNLGTIGKEDLHNSHSYKPVTVQEGDTLWALAQKSNLEMDINAIINETMTYNQLYNTYIQPGQTLYIPCKDLS